MKDFILTGFVYTKTACVSKSNWYKLQIVNKDDINTPEYIAVYFEYKTVKALNASLNRMLLLQQGDLIRIVGVVHGKAEQSNGGLMFFKHVWLEGIDFQIITNIKMLNFDITAFERNFNPSAVMKRNLEKAAKLKHLDNKKYGKKKKMEGELFKERKETEIKDIISEESDKENQNNGKQ